MLHSIKERVRVEPAGDRWLLSVDEKAVLSAQEGAALRELAVTLQKALAGDLAP